MGEEVRPIVHVEIGSIWLTTVAAGTSGPPSRRESWCTTLPSVQEEAQIILHVVAILVSFGVWAFRAGN